MAGPEGIVFGEGHHLPDASILKGFDFRANSLGLRSKGGQFFRCLHTGQDRLRREISVARTE